MKNTIKKVLKKATVKVLSFFIPEIQVLVDKDNYWSGLKLIKSNTTTGRQVKTFEPYKLYDAQIGDYTYIAQNSFISKANIGKFCSIGPNFFCGWGIHPVNGISTAPMFYSTLKQNGITLSSTNKVEERKYITIGNDVFIGSNVTVLDGVTIGDGAVIGAGSVVSKNIPPYAIALGCPIEIVKYRFDDKQINELLKIKWWDFDEKELMEVEKLFFDIDQFINKYAKS